MHDSSTDCYNSNNISLHPQEDAANNYRKDNVMESANICIQIWADSHETWILHATSKRADFMPYSIEDVKRIQMQCDELLHNSSQLQV